MDRFAFFLGLVGLAISIFTSDRYPEVATALFWIGLAGIVWGGWLLVRHYRDALVVIIRTASGYHPMIMVLERPAINATEAQQDKIHRRVEELAQSGQIVIYGERGSIRKLTSIPAEYWKEHGIFWSRPTQQVQTFDNTKSLGDQDTDDIYFNLYIVSSDLRLIYAKPLETIAG
ncbi:hypothetical protein [Mesorhizobium sp. LjNodule214]|uniref:hypothetical protein n=1 Tax=Mesorhizobium sp. LjNodule214 TaxID=3342252 RepID=UPI003ECD4DDC